MNASDRLDAIRVLKAVAAAGVASVDGFTKCDRVIRAALESLGPWNAEMETAVGNTGYEQPDVAGAYDAIRALILNGMLQGRGDLAKPAGPRYTECRLTPEGRRFLDTPV